MLDQPHRVLAALDALVGYSAAIHDQRERPVSLFGETGDDLPGPRLAPVADWLPSGRAGEAQRRWGSTSPATRSTTTCRP
ncbi:MAG: hypothetical protein R3D80_20595 [Paracoccaceae bacterium]